MKTIGIVSGCFNPLHRGHLEYINASKAKCDELLVIVNNDVQISIKHKNSFMDETHRSTIIKNLKCVDSVIVSIDLDKSQCNTIKYIRSLYKTDNLIFFNSGDRDNENRNEDEYKICNELNIKYEFIPLPKLYSSSKLLNVTPLNEQMLIKKGWGHEIIFSNTPLYCGKLLIFKKDKKFSMHYHIKKDETWYISKGKFICKLIDTVNGTIKESELKEGDKLHIPPGLPHQLIALEDSIIFEVSTEHFDNDSYRIYKGD